MSTQIVPGPFSSGAETSGHFEAPRSITTDDADAQGFGLYGAVGRLGGEHPEAALRVGVYGSFMPVPWEAVSAGDRGPFRDIWTESQRGERAAAFGP